jgi:hypothetical protein
VRPAAPEERLLLECARAPVHPAPRPLPPLPAGPAEERFLALARRNGLLPLAHRLLGGWMELPAGLRAVLSAAQGANARRALALAAELRRLVAALEGAGVPAAAYKGPALAVRAYGSLAVREYADLDLLVAPEDLPAAAALLEARGYLPAHRFPPRAEAAFRRWDGDYPFAHAETGELVELHTRVSSRRFGVELPTRDLLARARPVPLGGGEVPALADDDLFLALALHGAKHRWSRLEWVASLGALAVRAGLDLEAAAARAEAAGGRRVLLLGLRLLRDALALPLPAPLDRAVDREPEVAALAAESVELWRAAEPPEGETTAANLRYNLRLREGARERLRYAARWLLVPSPEDWGWVRLPEPLSPLYAALRPLRLAARYGPWSRG